MPNVTLTENSRGVVAYEFGNEVTLRRLVLATFLTENDASLTKQIAELVPRVNPAIVHALAVTARKEYALRKVPLLLAREMARHETHRVLVADTLEQVIERADELGAFLELYFGGKSRTESKEKLSRQVRLGLGRALAKFNRYALVRYDRNSSKFSMQDIIRLVHPKPENDERNELYRKVAKGEDLGEIRDWERVLSQSTNKLEAWTSVLDDTQYKIGGLALLKNMRNMLQAGISEDRLIQAIEGNPFRYVLPFRFISALRAVEQWKPPSSALRNALESAMFRGLAEYPRFDGDTVFLVDISGSMGRPLGLSFQDRRGASFDSGMSRSDGAQALTMLLREVCDTPHIYTFGSRITRVDGRGFALGASVKQQNQNTLLGSCLKQAKHDLDLRGVTPKRLIVITDEESADAVGEGFSEYNYMVNVKSTSYSIAFGKWTRAVGFSEHILKLISEAEALDRYVKEKVAQIV